MIFFNIICVIVLTLIVPTFAKVSLNIEGLQAQLKNDFVELNFNVDSSISTLLVNGQNIAARVQKTFYLDWNYNGQGVFNPNGIFVVEQSDQRVHFYWLQNDLANFFDIELHYIMEDGLSGVYCYAKYINNQNQNVAVGETRIIYRFESTILSQGTNQKRMGTTPTLSELKNTTMVQDATWQFANGTYYSKYDYAEYIREINYHGAFGNGYGAFVVSASKEYHGGGAMKQDLTVHQESLVSNYFMSSHFGNHELNAPPGWKHIYGPFLIFFPTGNDGQILQAVENQVAIEQSKWPYSFVNDAEYPLKRGQVSGMVTGQKKAQVVLYDSLNEEYNTQQLGYLYTVKTDNKGYFLFKNVRPGQYKIVAYPLSGQGIESLATVQVQVEAGKTEHAGLYLAEPTNIIWSIGEANRRSSEFKYSDEPRNYEWEWMPPVNNTFIIGQSDPKNDWYYAQSQPGQWNIKYQDKPDGKGRTLRVALAGASIRPHLIITLNGHKVLDVYFDNDSAVYRSAMQSGKYHFNVIQIRADQIVDGENVLELSNGKGQIMYDAISLARD